jgi:hypothetical protein
MLHRIIVRGARSSDSRARRERRRIADASISRRARSARLLSFSRERIEEEA